MRLSRPCMATGRRERAPLSTDGSHVETEADPHASGRCVSTRETETHTLRRGATDPAQPEVTSSDERLVIGQTLSGRYRIERELGAAMRPAEGSLECCVRKVYPNASRDEQLSCGALFREALSSEI